MCYSITVLAFHHHLSAFFISYNIFHCYGEAVELDTCLRMEHHGLAWSTTAYRMQHRNWHQYQCLISYYLLVLPQQTIFRMF